MTAKPCLTWSYGGGVQSVTIGVLIRQGALPVPDLAAIADTSRECATTWEYLRDHMQPYLDPIGLQIQVVPHTLARVDLYDRTGLTMAPAYTAEGRKAAFCSGEWKRDVMERWLRLQGVKECVQWIGYSLDEVWRVKNDHRPWCHLEFPLIDRMVNRAMCGALITAAGLPMPKESRCWMCPHQTPDEWREVQSRPEEWAAAIALDRQIRERDPEQAGLYLYSGRVPLEMADFSKDAGLLAPAKPCETGHCWT
jgi:hypothetical protein